MTGAAPDRSHAQALDRADPLASFRDRFLFAEPGPIYLCGNSLGVPPKAGAERITSTVAEWAGHLVAGWHDELDWLDLPRRVGDLLAGPILGAQPGEVVVSDSTSVNLYKLVVAARAAVEGRDVVVTSARDFPTDRYVTAGLGGRRVMTADPVEGPTVESVSAALDDRVAVVVLSHVDYRSAAVADMGAITAAVHDAGALMLWDLSHSAGCYPVALHDAGVDLAVGCTYKYLCAGPGAPAFLYVRRDLQARLRQPIWGWFGQADQFEMGDQYRPWPDVRRFLVGTPPVIALAAVQGGVEVLTEAGMPAVRTKALALGTLAVELHQAWLAERGFVVASPGDALRRGSHLSLEHGEGQRLHRDLAAKAGVITDFRFPNLIRVGLAPLTTRFVDVWDAFDRLRELSY